MKVRNTFIIFLVSGFWHGANWTYIIWGGLNALYFLPLLLAKKNRTHLETVAEGRWLPSLKEAGQMLLTFGLTVIAWIFFRADSVGHALTYLGKIFTVNFLNSPETPVQTSIFTVFSLLLIFIIVEWHNRQKDFALYLEPSSEGNTWIRRGFYLALVYAIFIFQGAEQEFIYFQF
jgi:D-alanyl-lipoteichoic acid acyltransferase DltB (MBOAT superfamily)